MFYVDVTVLAFLVVMFVTAVIVKTYQMKTVLMTNHLMTPTTMIHAPSQKKNLTKMTSPLKMTNEYEQPGSQGFVKKSWELGWNMN